jgi:hypothetical protein
MPNRQERYVACQSDKSDKASSSCRHHFPPDLDFQANDNENDKFDWFGTRIVYPSDEAVW